ncbi:hypothetical protein FNH22_00810 [Fulvivirga sp. M361]|uniref:hypothetical protein n=1 Tax=Fulvivirga sp. M361 TaxID=2594266 RepID=UPI00117A6C9C|nr:hypothetical protein [Fulvivirga sp. M361]TRX62667.1 hypothetical protein FNH22_00810 [Fulvivirga sp. M361]
MNQSVVRLFILILNISIIGCSKVDQKKEVAVSMSFEDLKIKADKYYQADDYENALKLYTDLIYQDSSVGEFWYRRGYSLAQLNYHETSVPDYLKSIELDYRRYDSYYTLGLYHATILRNDSLAHYYLNKALELKPSSSEVNDILKTLSNSDEVNI